MPSIKRRWSATNKMTMGKTMIRAAAMTTPQSEEYCPDKRKNDVTAVRVSCCCRNVVEIRNSFHEYRPMISATVRMPGEAMGSMILENICQAVAPSTSAASSNSFGMARK